MVYLCIGQDPPSKHAFFQKIKENSLPAAVASFNQDTLYARELTLRDLQEKLLCLPVKSAKRLILIKEAQGLKKEVKEFLVRYCRKPSAHIILILDVERTDKYDLWLKEITGLAKVYRFREEIPPNTFTLGRQIESGKIDVALHLLHRLLKEGERPERIIGGLRYAWGKEGTAVLETRRRLKFLLRCDVEIKTGKLPPLLALERLVIGLCATPSLRSSTR
ncbi:MAG: hypothetical protein KKC84_06365 [Candidatus Omnitrophica bacterium]|nr:hypothetical protein [Candidatus Omnitrophota bacterium]